MVKAKNIGIEGIKEPKGSCDDDKCPFHGSLKVRGRIFKGKVVSDKMSKTVIVEWPRIIRLRKYKRYMKKRSKVSAHNPECVNAKTGDLVTIMECRPLSKTKKFVVIEVGKK
jgi:small subunit ribosomal protein S17